MVRFGANIFKEPSLTSRPGLLGFLRAILAEFLGTLLFVLISTGAACPALPECRQVQLTVIYQPQGLNKLCFLLCSNYH